MQMHLFFFIRLYIKRTLIYKMGKNYYSLLYYIIPSIILLYIVRGLLTVNYYGYPSVYSLLFYAIAFLTKYRQSSKKTNGSESNTIVHIVYNFFRTAIFQNTSERLLSEKHTHISSL